MWPKTLRNRLIILTAIAVTLPLLGSEYYTTLNSERALILEKERKLFGVTRMLDSHLISDYQSLLAQSQMQDATRQEKILCLNKLLRGYTDQVAAAYPGVGVGYYARELDAIITYGPSHVYHDTVGKPISQSHQGRLVMQTGVERVQIGDLVRGPIMNAMYPIIRNGQVIGYIWANELVADIQAEIGAMKKQVYFSVFLGICLSLIGVGLLVNHLLADITRIKNGLMRLHQDLSHRLPPLKGEMGEIVCAINDMAAALAQQKMLEEKINRTERLASVGEVSAGMAHEIRNPLMSIQGFAQLLTETMTGPEQQDYLRIILRETERMKNLTGQILNLVRPQPAAAELLDMNMVLEDTLLLVQKQASRAQITIHRCLSDKAATVWADRSQICQVILNIVINAMQAISGAGEIDTAVTVDGGWVQLSVHDSGCGILPENIGKLFDPLYTTKETGTGLGLTVAHRLAEQWGGDILVDSTLGKGSTFILILPYHEEGGYGE